MTPPTRRFERYVAIGDSSTEGLDDPDGAGGYRGWSRRLARMLVERQGSVRYANLGVRGERTREVLERQLSRALAMEPDLATVFSGTNDVLAPRFNAAAVGNDFEHMQRALIGGGATVLSFTLPDLAPLMPVARPVSHRIRALNDALREASRRSGAILLDFAALPVAVDRRLWSEDRIHANAAGHARIADALASALGLPGTDTSWTQPLPPDPWTWRDRVRAEARWWRRHFLPWVLAPRRLGGRPSRERSFEMALLTA